MSNVENYIGYLDPLIPSKLKEFEKEYSREIEKKNLYIVAPKQSFLKLAPKDPLMFYQLTDDKFYLIHKWGNDLSILRKILYFPMRTWLHWNLFLTLFTLIFGTGLFFIIRNILALRIQDIIGIEMLFIPIFFVALLGVVESVKGISTLAWNEYYRWGRRIKS